MPAQPAKPHHKKRHGHHHKVSKHYAKTYWPYLPMLLIVGVGILLNTLWSTKNAVLSYATSVSATTLLQETNVQRSQNGRSALALNNQLSQAAQEKANDMSTRDYWSHITPEGQQPWQFISAAGYRFSYAGENLAYGFDSSAHAVAGWMNSAGHRENLLSGNYTDVGFGFANSPNYQNNGEQTIIVAMYAAPAKKIATAPAPVTPKPKKETPTPAPATAAPVTTPTPPPVAPETQAAPTETPRVPTQATEQPAPKDLQQQNVSRIDVLTVGNTEWAVLTASALITIGAITLVYRHGRMWRRFLTKGERFIIKHPLFDIALTAAVVAAFLLTRTTGFIH